MLSLNGILQRAALQRYLPTVQAIKPDELLKLARLLTEEDDQLARRLHAALTIALEQRFPGDAFYEKASPKTGTDG